EGGIRTPIILRWPGKIAPGRDDVTLVSSIDLAPTVLAACGVAPPSSLSGVNLAKLSESDAPKRDTLYGEIFEHDVVALDDPQAGLVYGWLMEGWWKLIVPKNGQHPEHYNLRDDPWEKQNMAADHPDIVHRLSKKLDAWWALQPAANSR